MVVVATKQKQGNWTTDSIYKWCQLQGHTYQWLQPVFDGHHHLDVEINSNVVKNLVVIRKLKARQTELVGVDGGIVMMMIDLEGEFTSDNNNTELKVVETN